MVDNKDLNSDVRIKFKIDSSTKNRRGFKCNSEDNGDGFSTDSIECTDTNNNDIIWVKVLRRLMLKNPLLNVNFFTIYK